MSLILGFLATAPAVASDLVSCKQLWREEKIEDHLPQPGTAKAYEAHYRRIQRRKCEKEWLVLVYMAADNDLSPYGFRDLWEMESVGSSISVDVLAFNDNAQKDGMRYLHIAKNEKLPEIPKTEEEELAFLEKEGPDLVVSPDAREPLPEGDSGSLKTAGDFIRWAIRRYPSKRIFLIGWSHAEGFDAPLRKNRAAGKKGGFALDLNPEDGIGKATHMAVTEMAAGMKEMLKELRGGKPLDIAGSDACLNQQIEFGYEWESVADYVFGSSTIVQKKGFNYHVLLDWLTSHPLKPTKDLAEAIPVLYRRSVNPPAFGERSRFASYLDPFATMATWETSKLVYVHRAMEDLATAILEWIGTGDDASQRVRELREDVVAKAHRFGGISSDLYNLLQLIESWAGEKDLKAILKEARSTSNRLVDAVTANYVGNEYLKKGTAAAIKTSKGVAVWLPTTRDESDEMLPKLKRGRFYKKEGKTAFSNWSRFVSKLYED